MVWAVGQVLCRAAKIPQGWTVNGPESIVDTIYNVGHDSCVVLVQRPLNGKC